jgi:outer membrane protein
MRGRDFVQVAAALALSLLAEAGRAEDLREAWDEAIRVNAGFQARQLDRMSADMNLGAARSARLPSASLFAFDSILSQSPADRVPAALAGTGSSAARAPVAFPILGPNQSNFPFALGSITQPLYQGGRLRYNIQAANAAVSYRKTEEHRTILDLKLTVAEAYVRVLRANKNLEVARSSTAQLSAFRRDVLNREQEGRATRNEELAAQVSLANARLREIEAQREVDSAWNMYNRYLYRPPTTVVDL